MADENDDLQGDDDQKVAITVKDLRALRTIAKEHATLKQSQAAAERELAFARSGLDMTDPRMSYFVKGYEGELDPAKIKEAAASAGFVQSDEQAQQQQAQHQQRQQEMSQQRKLDRASAGADETGDQDLLQAINAAKSPEEVMRIMVQAGSATSWNRPSD